MVVSATQMEMAEVLVQELKAFGTVSTSEDVEGEILTDILLLDALACGGLALYKPEGENPASQEYIESLRSTATSSAGSASARLWRFPWSMPFGSSLCSEVSER